MYTFTADVFFTCICPVIIFGHPSSNLVTFERIFEHAWAQIEDVL